MARDAIQSEGAIGVDIGGHGLKAVRVTASGLIVDRGRIALDGVDDRRATRVEASVHELVETLDPGGQLPVGVGVPGFHDQTTGLLRQSPNFPGWEDRAVAEHLRDLLGRRVATENDGNCALLGEAWTGAARGVRNVVMLTLGTGVGSGFLVGGTLLTGARGAGAEGGHIAIHRDGRLCGCGRRGCLETYASGPGLQLTGAEEHRAAPEGRAPERPEDIFEASDRGEKWAVAAVARFSSDLADGLVPLVHLFAPAAIVLGGGVGGAFDRFAPELERLLRQRAIPACLAGALPLRHALLGGDSGAVGAARLVLTGDKHQ